MISLNTMWLEPPTATSLSTATETREDQYRTQGFKQIPMLCVQEASFSLILIQENCLPQSEKGH